MRALGSSGVWELFVPDVGDGCRYKFQILGADGEWRSKADPMAFRTEVPPATASVVYTSALQLAGRASGCSAGPATAWHAAPMSIYEVHLGSWRLGLGYRSWPTNSSSTCSSCGFTHVEFLPVAEHPVRWLLGLSGVVVLRPVRPFRRPGRAALPDRRAAPGGHRRPRRLGARALPQGRMGAGPFRRHAAVRARRPAPRRAAGLGHLRLQLRPQRGAQLPGRQRAVLAGGVPRRRPAGRRRRVDALPGLLAQGRRVGAEHPRRPREPGGGRRSCRR